MSWTRAAKREMLVKRESPLLVVSSVAGIDLHNGSGGGSIAANIEAVRGVVRGMEHVEVAGGNRFPRLRRRAIAGIENNCRGAGGS